MPISVFQEQIPRTGNIGGANIHISCFALLISFEIDCF